MMRFGGLFAITLFGSLATTLDDLPAPAAFGNLTATAILGWYAWYTASKTIPNLMSDFRAELAARRAEYVTDRDLFRREMAEERAQRHADNLAIVEVLQRLAAQWEVRRPQYDSGRRSTKPARATE